MRSSEGVSFKFANWKPYIIIDIVVLRKISSFPSKYFDFQKETLKICPIIFVPL